MAEQSTRAARNPIPPGWQRNIEDQLELLAKDTGIPFSAIFSADKCSVVFVRSDQQKFRIGPFFHGASALNWIEGYKRAYQDGRDSMMELRKLVNEPRHECQVVIKRVGKQWYGYFGTNGGRLSLIPYQENPSFALVSVLSTLQEILPAYKSLEIYYQEEGNAEATDA